MKILFTGGGTGGHFYPIIALAEALRRVAEEDKLVMPKLYYMSDAPYNPKALFEHNIKFVYVPAGKLRPYFSFLNLWDYFKIFWGGIIGLIRMFFIFPDVVFGKGAYASFPALLAARILGIPVMIHDSDSIPGRVNLWAGRFAERVALSYPEAVKYFAPDKTAVTGNPIREGILVPVKNGALEYLDLAPEVPVVLILGGSSGAVRINDTVMGALDTLVNKCQIIHQVGKANVEDCRKQSSVILANNPNKQRYKMFDYLNDTAMRMAAGAANLVVSRGGSAIFEIANWGLPSIIIPIPESISHDQKTNAYTYARGGGAVVIDEENLTPSVLFAEIKRLLDDEALRATMSAAALKYSNQDAGRTIAKQLVAIALTHEK